MGNKNDSNSDFTWRVIAYQSLISCQMQIFKPNFYAFGAQEIDMTL